MQLDSPVVDNIQHRVPADLIFHMYRSKAGRMLRIAEFNPCHDPAVAPHASEGILVILLPVLSCMSTAYAGEGVQGRGLRMES